MGVMGHPLPDRRAEACARFLSKSGQAQERGGSAAGKSEGPGGRSPPDESEVTSGMC